MVDVAGNPVRDAIVVLFRKQSPESSTSTDAQGRFHFPDQGHGRATLRARSPAGLSASFELELGASEIPPAIRLELRTGATVSGWVLDPEGAGVADSVVEVERYLPGIVEERRHDRKTRRQVEVQGDTEVDLELDAEAVTGRVLSLGERRPVPGRPSRSCPRQRVRRRR